MIALERKVRDLGVAAALLSSGHELKGTSIEPDGRVNFLFDTDDGTTDTVKAYWADTLNIKARTFFENTKMLKGVIYAERGSP